MKSSTSSFVYSENLWLVRTDDTLGRMDFGASFVNRQKVT